MTGIRHRRAWIWVAITAIAIATIARAEAGLLNAKNYTRPVVELFTGAHDPQSTAKAAPARATRFSSERQGSFDSGVWAAILPVLFVGLVSPLCLIPTRSLLCLGRAPAAPALAALFQRPPPALLL